MKYISRLTALLLALIILITTASAQSFNPDGTGLTRELLDALYESASKDGIVVDSGILGQTTTIEAFDDTLFDKDLYTDHKWHLNTEDGEVISRDSALTVPYTLENQFFVCTAKGNILGILSHTSKTYMVPAATNPEPYLNYLFTNKNAFTDRQSTYDFVMKNWNVSYTEQDGSSANLGSRIIAAWAADIEDESVLPADLFCTCVAVGDGLNYHDCMLPPDGPHKQDCPWFNGVIMPPLPEQPPLYGGEPNGMQYTATETVSLPNSNTRAVILPEGGRAILTYSGLQAQSRGGSGNNWQVFTGEDWVDIQGDTAPSIVVTEAKLHSIYTMTGIAQLRYVNKDDAVVLASATVTSEAIASGDYFESTEPISTRLTAMTKADPQPGELCNVVIEYRLDDNTMAATPYPANIYYDAPIDTQNVISPSVMGYMPTVITVSPSTLLEDGSVTANKNADGAIESVRINMAHVTQHITVTVTYTPAVTTYTVKHYQQNVSDDNYTLVETETKEGLTNAIVGGAVTGPSQWAINDKKEYPGFRAMVYDGNAEIAADGSTVVEIYYDRNYYLLKLDNNGGFGAESIYARYETPIGTIAEPKRTGYTFNGWLGAGESFASSAALADKYKTMPLNGGNFTAQWTADEVNYTIVYWRENADDSNYSFWAQRATEKTKAGNVLDGTTVKHVKEDGLVSAEEADHFTLNTEKTDKNVTIKGDGTSVINVYYSRNTYTITFVPGRTDVEFKILKCTKEEHQHSEEEGCYGKCTHEHTIDCWSGLENKTGSTTKPNNINVTNPVSGQVYSYQGTWSTYYYLYFDGKWYDGKHDSWTGNPTTQPTLNCNHNHTDACLSCTKEVHTHDDSCYKDGASNEYKITAKYDSDITYVWETDPIKGLLDNGYVFQSDKTEKYYSFLEKMPNQNITMTTTKWSGDQYTWYYYLEVLPGQDTTGLTLKTDGGKTYYLYHTTKVNGGNISLTYEEDYFPITGYTQRDKGVPSFDRNRVAYLYYTRNSHTLEFQNADASQVKRYEGVPFDQPMAAYTRDDQLVRNIVPSYPQSWLDTYGQQVHTFEGWYTTPECYKGTEVEWDTLTMPDTNLTLYAYWKPIKYNVRFFLDKEDLDAYSKGMDKPDEELGYDPDSTSSTFIPKQTPDFNTTINPVNDPKNGYLIFIGWFYNNNGTERMFDQSMPITQDLDLYGKWYLNQLQPIYIRYALDANGDNKPDTYENGSIIYVAEQTTTSLLVGNPRAFYAKGGVQLFEAYRVGYFPITNSHSVTAREQYDPKDNPDPVKEYEWFPVVTTNDDGTTTTTYVQGYTFLYRTGKAMPYTVRYLTENDPGNNLGTVDIVMSNGEPKPFYRLREDTEYPNNAAAIVDEPYIHITGYMPDATQKRLILSLTEEDNVINFFYTKDEVHAPVTVRHMTEIISPAENPQDFDDNYTEYQSYMLSTQKIGDDYAVDALNIPGFRFHLAKANGTELSGTNADGKDAWGQIEQSGLELVLYYKRIEYPYEFRYREQFTEKELRKSDTGTAPYQASVSKTWVDIPGYRLVSDQKIVFNIAIENPEGVAKNNVRTFYYVEDEKTINYVVVGPNGLNDVAAGSLTSTSETVKAVTGVAAGSTPMANEYYEFVGWYEDADCTKPVDSKWLEGNTIKPQKNAEGMYEEKTYYAKFAGYATFKYVVVEPDKYCNATLQFNTIPTGDTSERVTAEDNKTLSEKVNVVEGTAVGGCVLGYKRGPYQFAGWYADESCTQLITKNLEYAPQKDTTYGVSADYTVGEKTFYAKFEPIMGELTILKNGLLPGDNAIVTVQMISPITLETTTYTLVFSSEQNKAVIKNVMGGTAYSVSEQTGWSWLYNNGGNPIIETNAKLYEEVILQEDLSSAEVNALAGKWYFGGNQEVTITNIPEDDQWLHDESSKPNAFTLIETTTQQQEETTN